MEQAHRLDKLIVTYIEDGYRLLFRDARCAQLVRPKAFSFWLGIINFPLAIVAYLFSRDDHVYIWSDGADTAIVEQRWELPRPVALVIGLLVLAELLFVIALISRLLA